MSDEKRTVDLREEVRVVSSKDFVTAAGLDGISLKARKLLYTAIAQCKKTDREFYEFHIRQKEFADLMQISASNVFREADSITDELMRGFIKVRKTDGSIGVRKYSLFSICDVDQDGIRFRISRDMTEFFLGLKKDFTQPLLKDFIKMRSAYSMAIWHLMQTKIKRRDIGISETVEFDMTLDELRSVLPKERVLRGRIVPVLYNRFSDVKEVLDKAIREICDNCGIHISYVQLKHGRKIAGFHCTAQTEFHVDEQKVSKETKERAEKGVERIHGQMFFDMDGRLHESD